MADNNILTLSGKEALEKELERLTTVDKPQAAAELNAARSLGDLSENADYDVAIERFKLINARIDTIRHILSHATIVDESAIDKSVISVGSGKVKVVRVDNGREFEFSIVGATEADPMNGKISNNSPVAKALIGHKVGDVVSVHAKIDYELKVVKIGD